MAQGGVVVDSPPFESNVTDRQVLALSDEHYKPHTWSELKEIIKSNDLAILKRKPSDLIRYIQWAKDITAACGSPTNYLYQERLHWAPLPLSTSSIGPVFTCRSNIPFKDPDDFKILRNDWPYGLAPGITHILVWLKNRIATDSDTGDLTPKSRQTIEDFVQRTFIGKLDRNDAADSVLWFKNWVALQSVRSLDHIHVLVRNVPDGLLREWTH